MLNKRRLGLFFGVALLALLVVSAGAQEEVLFSEDFSDNAADWRVEINQQTPVVAALLRESYVIEADLLDREIWFTVPGANDFARAPFFTDPYEYQIEFSGLDSNNGTGCAMLVFDITEGLAQHREFLFCESGAWALADQTEAYLATGIHPSGSIGIFSGGRHTMALRVTERDYTLIVEGAEIVTIPSLGPIGGTIGFGVGRLGADTDYMYGVFDNIIVRAYEAPGTVDAVSALLGTPSRGGGAAPVATAQPAVPAVVTSTLVPTPTLPRETAVAQVYMTATAQAQSARSGSARPTADFAGTATASAAAQAADQQATVDALDTAATATAQARESGSSGRFLTFPSRASGFSVDYPEDWLPPVELDNGSVIMLNDIAALDVDWRDELRRGQYVVAVLVIDLNTDIRDLGIVGWTIGIVGTIYEGEDYTFPIELELNGISAAYSDVGSDGVPRLIALELDRSTLGIVQGYTRPGDMDDFAPTLERIAGSIELD